MATVYHRSGSSSHASASESSQRALDQPLSVANCLSKLSGRTSLPSNQNSRDLCASIVITYASFIGAAGKSVQPGPAIEAFNEAKEKKCINRLTYDIFMDLLIESGFLLEIDVSAVVEFYYQESGLRPCIRTEGKRSLIDLHDFSHGTGIVLIREWAKQNPSIREFGVITGKGRLNEGNYLAAKESIKTKGAHYLPQFVIQDDLVNEGRLNFIVR